MSKPILGVLGGMGPLASALFMELVTNKTLAEKDQDHLDIILYSMASIPERTGYILGETTNSPLYDLKKYIIKLRDSNVSLVAIPCVTATYFYNDIKNLGVQVANIAEIALNAATDNSKIGILATTGTINAGFFQNYTNKSLIFPDNDYQHMLMDVIYSAIKGGHKFDNNIFNLITDNLLAKGCDIIILGCTELSIINNWLKLNPLIFIDAMEELAKFCIETLGKKVKV